MSATASKNLTMFNKLCGDDALKNVILGTTKWGDTAAEVGLRHEQQLADDYWKTMIEKGSEMTRFTNTRESAWGTVNLLQSDRAPIAARIQHELIDLQKILPETEAAQALRDTLQRFLDAQTAYASSETREKMLHSITTEIRDLKCPLAEESQRF